MAHSLTETPAAWPRVVMIHGLMESGKSTLASYFVERFGYERIKFADALKNMIRVLLSRAGVPGEMIERYVEGDLKKTPIPELNDPARPENHVQNLDDAGVTALMESLLRDCGMTPSQVAAHLHGPNWDVPIALLNGVTTAARLYQTLINEWSRGMLAGQVITVRLLMQSLGEEWRNMHSQRLWAQITKAKAIALLALGKKVVIDDNRYLFELQEFAELRPKRFVVTRGNKHFLPITEDTHPSERPMPIDWFDCWIANNGTREALWVAAIEALEARARFDLQLAAIRARHERALKQEVAA